MKKSLLLMFICSIVFLSCSKDDDEQTLGSIIGTWTWQSIEVEGIEVPISTIGVSLKITFNSSGTWSASASGMPVSFGNGTYSVNGNKIIIKELGDIYTWKIISITENKAILDWEDYGYKMILVR